MSVWQTETKAISRQEKVSGQRYQRKLEEGQGHALLWITTYVPPREDFSLQEAKPRTLTCILEEHSSWT